MAFQDLILKYSSLNNIYFFCIKFIILQLCLIFVDTRIYSDICLCEQHLTQNAVIILKMSKESEQKLDKHVQINVEIDIFNYKVLANALPNRFTRKVLVIFTMSGLLHKNVYYISNV